MLIGALCQGRGDKKSIRSCQQRGDRVVPRLPQRFCLLYNRTNYEAQRRQALKTILERSRYLAFIGIVPLLLASLAAFVWGMLQTFEVVLLVITSLGGDKSITVGFIKIVDIFLIATALLIFTASLYKLFIGNIDIPEWMLAEDLYELKGKLSSMVVLVMAVKFLELFMQNLDANELLLRAIAVTLVSAVLIAFGYFGKRN
jgi:uncharacterized membrane protein YqhA